MAHYAILSTSTGMQEGPSSLWLTMPSAFLLFLPPPKYLNSKKWQKQCKDGKPIHLLFLKKKGKFIFWNVLHFVEKKKKQYHLE